MAEAARVVLGGMDVRTDVKVFSWPNRFADPRGQEMWDRVMRLLQPDPLKVDKVAKVGKLPPEGCEGLVATP